MQFLLDFFLHNPIGQGLGGGLIIGIVGVILVTLRMWEARRETKRLKRHLTDKMELEADATTRLKSDLQELKQQNENLRIKVSSLSQLPDRRMQREVEMYNRAERFMVARSPGFPAVWEEAKRSAVEEMQHEEHGHSLPKRFFNSLVNRSPRSAVTETENEAQP